MVKMDGQIEIKSFSNVATEKVMFLHGYDLLRLRFFFLLICGFQANAIKEKKLDTTFSPQ